MKARTTMAALMITGCIAMSACADDEVDEAGDIGATCGVMATIEGPEDITVEKLDELLAVTPTAIEAQVQLIRDRIAEDGEVAYEDPEVGEAFGAVGAFEESACA